MRRDRRYMLRGILGTLACAGVGFTPIAAQTTSIHATSIQSGDFLGYFGLGDLGGGVGHGTYQLGNCAYDGISRSFCTTTGTYVEVAGSVNPGATGTFTWRMTWLGSGANPIEARSISPGSNTLSLHSVPNGSFFEVLLGNGMYANLDFGAPDTPNPGGGTLNWQAFLSGNATCTGSPATCSVGDVGLAVGSGISSNLGAFDMQLDFPRPPITPVPEPSSLALVAAGVMAIAVQRYRRRVGERQA